MLGGRVTDLMKIALLGSSGGPTPTGRNLVIDANLIMGNSAESGSGGGLRLQGVNGQEVAAFPTNNGANNRWYQVSVTNNIIANNVAGWDGAGISLLDAQQNELVDLHISKPSLEDVFIELTGSSLRD